MASQEWSNPDIAKVYSQKAANPEINWFEYEVNVPAMLALMPTGAKKVLDFGCGVGDVTAMLAEKFPLVEGCDPSSVMLDLARKDFPRITFFEWEAIQPLKEKDEYYDVVFSKLAMHFVEDLRPVANQLFAVLGHGGNLVFSVPHPMSTVRKINGASYWERTPYPSEIGCYGIHTTMIHRSIQDYVEPFVSSGFVLTAINEPQIPAATASKNHVADSDTILPKRINFKFLKT